MQKNRLWLPHLHQKSQFSVSYYVAMAKKREWPKHPKHPLYPTQLRHKKDWSTLVYANKHRIPKRSLPEYQSLHGVLPFRTHYPKDPQTNWRLQRLYDKAHKYDPHMEFITRDEYKPTLEWLQDYSTWYSKPVTFPNDILKEEFRVKIVSSKLFRRARRAHLHIRKAAGGSYCHVKLSDKDRDGTTILLDSLYHRLSCHRPIQMSIGQKTKNRPVMSWYISHLIEKQRFVSWKRENSELSLQQMNMNH